MPGVQPDPAVAVFVVVAAEEHVTERAAWAEQDRDREWDHRDGREIPLVQRGHGQQRRETARGRTHPTSSRDRPGSRARDCRGGRPHHTRPRCHRPDWAISGSLRSNRASRSGSEPGRRRVVAHTGAGARATGTSNNPRPQIVSTQVVLGDPVLALLPGAVDHRDLVRRGPGPTRRVNRPANRIRRALSNCLLLPSCHRRQHTPEPPGLCPSEK